MNYLRKFIIIFSILSYTNFIGLIDSDKVSIGIPLRDYALAFIILYLFYRFYNYFYLLNRYIKYNYLRPVLIISALATLYIVTMPLRGDITLVQGFKAGRQFLTLLLAIVIYEDIYYSRSSKFIFTIITILGIVYTFLSILNNFIPDTIASIFSGGDILVSEDAWDSGSARYVLRGNSGIYFIHVSYAIYLFKYLYYRDKTDLYLLLLFSLGILMHGYRSPLVVFAITSIVIIFLRLKIKQSMNYLFVIFFVGVFIYFTESLVGKNIIMSKFESAYNELSGEYSGSFESRLDRSMNYQIPMFLKSKWIGYGFVHKESKLAHSIGHEGDGRYSLYYIDFGYGTLLNYFGIFGSLIFIFTIIKTLNYSFFYSKKERKYYKDSIIVFIVAFLIINYSFALLESLNGLLPLSVILGFTEGENQLFYYELNKSNEFFN